MFRLRRLLTLLPTLLTIALLLTGNAQAVLLDVGPTVPQVNPSTYPDLGHGFPLWYRDTNRVPLQLCTDQASGMCLTAEPNPAAPLSFPDNLGDELFWWSGDAIIDYAQQGVLTGAGQAILVQAIEAAFSTGGVVPGAQVSFARMRIRIDTPFVGTYLVTTPYKQFTFTVDAATIGDGRRAINFTEDLGLAEGGIFTGALNGSIGPFLYCTNAPIVRATGSFLGDPNVPCQVLGSTFAPPGGLPAPANYFRIQGPNGFDVSTNLFAVTGKLYTDPISTPLTVDKATYSRNALGMQYLSFATTQPLSNQVNTGLPFPDNFALTGAPSALEVAGTNIPTLTMATNNPVDGKFFASSDVVADPGTMPATITVTNTADTPVTTQVASLVDDVVISEAVYTPATRTLSITATSGDTVTPPTLQLFFPGESLPAGTLTSGQLSLIFPVTLGAKTYEIPPLNISVASSLGGSDTESVRINLPGPIAPATGVTLTPGAVSPQQVGTNVLFVAAASGGTGTYEYEFWLHDGTSWSNSQIYSTNNVWTWNTTNLSPGIYTVEVHARSAGSTAPFEATNALLYSLVAAPVAPIPATGATITAAPVDPKLPGSAIVFTAAGAGGSGTYEYEFWLHNGTSWSKVQSYSTANTFGWVTTGLPVGTYTVEVHVRSAGSTAAFEATSAMTYQLTDPATGATLTPSLASPQTAGTSVTFTASATGGSGNYEYAFFRNDGTTWTTVQPYSTNNAWIWDTTGATLTTYTIEVHIRNVGSTTAAETQAGVFYTIQ